MLRHHDRQGRHRQLPHLQRGEGLVLPEELQQQQQQQQQQQLDAAGLCADHSLQDQQPVNQLNGYIPYPL